MEPLLNVWDYEAEAAKRLEPGAYGYYAGGAGDEVTLRDNVAAYGRRQLRPRVLVDIAGCTTKTTVLGQEWSMPLGIAPVAFQRVAHPDGEVGMARAARDVGTAMCLSTLATSTPAEVAETGALRLFQLYVFKDPGVTRDLVAQARENGFTALVLTVDTPVLGRRERDFRTGFTIPAEIVVAAFGPKEGVTPHSAFAQMSESVTWRDVESFAAAAELPVLVKGVLTAEDARLACEHGAAGIVVSNHGGRQLDGGIRRGADVVKALALGARACLAGRAPLWGLVVGGEAGARRVLELIRDEIELALKLVGCASPADVTRAHIR